MLYQFVRANSQHTNIGSDIAAYMCRREKTLAATISVPSFNSNATALTNHGSFGAGVVVQVASVVPLYVEVFRH